MPVKATSKLRELMAADGCIVAPGCYDALTAQMVQEAGFPAVYLSAWGIHHSQFGLPHIGVLTVTEVAELARRIAAAVDIPLIVDVEHGFGGPFEVRRTVQELEGAGAAGIAIHDQVRGQGWMLRTDDVTAALVTEEQMTSKIAAAKDAQTDPDFVVIGRTESARISAEESVRRAQLWAAAGADVAMVIASPWLPYYRPDITVPRDEFHQMLRDWMAAIDAPLAIHSPFGIDYTISEVNELGIGMWIIPQACLGFAAASVRNALQAFGKDELREFNNSHAHLSLAGFSELVNQSSYSEIAQRYNV